MFGARFLTVVSAILLATAANAAPGVVARTVKPVEFEVFAPPVTEPTTGTVWSAGQVQTVTWDISGLDDAGKNTTGFLLLGYTIPGDTSGNEHLNITNPLANGFKLGDGAVNVTVPSVVPRDTYIVVLLGDSGDASKPFTITA
ncbi:hypothetical protein BC835DRAFT_1272477 [Cytidiella melzeri]|nr:hypothetical protein BC835DRAFT_1272477 [Cytidiella melzeri]